mmetsp:Transcript_18130/g.50335  ORF Transcript_18130/g.50335 Transcript_18130/m.50335 type:complete len:125 (-) Transcript_18130:122-496(-)
MGKRRQRRRARQQKEVQQQQRMMRMRENKSKSRSNRSRSRNTSSSSSSSQRVRNRVLYARILEYFREECDAMLNYTHKAQTRHKVLSLHKHYSFGRGCCNGMEVSQREREMLAANVDDSLPQFV